MPDTTDPMACAQRPVPVVELHAASVRVRSARADKTILDSLSLRFGEGEFVGILGASGSGKSTLMKLLAGMQAPSQGEILLEGDPRSASELLTDGRIAYLPQDVILHECLPAGVALDYVVRLKRPDAIDSERREVIERSLAQVGLSDRRGIRIDRLSGGQRKRVGLAAELIGSPRLLLLDEATSGLDPATEAEMMDLFRSLANAGRTVLCVTHHPSRLELCDRLIVLDAGRCAFTGTPAELKRSFQIQQFDQLYGRIKSGLPVLPIATAATKTPPSPVPHLAAALCPVEVPPHQPAPFSDQLADSITRYLRIQWADLAASTLQFFQAPIIAFMIGLTFGGIRASFAEQEAADTKQVLFVMTLSVLWCSGTASVREIVKEIGVVRQELRHGLDLRAYLLAKFLVLGGIASAQGVVLLAIVRAFTGLSGPFESQALALIATALAGSILGLAVSAFARSSERAMLVIPVVLIGLAIFSGGLARLSGLSLHLARVLSPAYWSLDGLRSSLRSTLLTATYPGSPGTYQAPILGAGGPLLLDCFILGAMTCTLFWIARLRLKRRLQA